VILVDHDPEALAVKLVELFIRYDLTDHTQDEVHARNIIQLIQEKDLLIDGCITFWEDCGPLAAHINDLMGLGGPSLRGALAAKKKSSTQTAIKLNSGHMKHLPSTALYSSKTFHISSAEDIDDAAAQMEYPCVMKLEFGSR